MYYVYFLKSEKDGGLYIGRTNDLARRLQEHKNGLVLSTKGRLPVLLLGYEICKTEKESIRLEKEFKKGYKREELRKKFNLMAW